MSIGLYDNALLDKLRNWTNNTNVSIVSPEESRRLCEMIADTNDDKPIQLPIISLKRPRGFEILNPVKTPLTFNGIALAKQEAGAVTLNAVPIRINYQIDVYTRYVSEADEYIRNFIFNIINYPKLSVTIPYNDINCTHDANIRLTAEVEDNSDIPERLISGQFTRLTMNIYIDDAYLWDIPLKGYKRVVGGQLRFVDSEPSIVEPLCCCKNK